MFLKGEFEVSFYDLVKRAEQGDCKSGLELAKNYFAGRGVKKDYAEAVKWFMFAAEDGSGEAEYFLANCYYQGLGVERNLKTALDYFLKARNHYYKDCSSMISDCMDELNLA